jgi:hypothetical protein
MPFKAIGFYIKPVTRPGAEVFQNLSATRDGAPAIEVDLG